MKGVTSVLLGVKGLNPLPDKKVALPVDDLLGPGPGDGPVVPGVGPQVVGIQTQFPLQEVGHVFRLTGLKNGIYKIECYLNGHLIVLLIIDILAITIAKMEYIKLSAT